MTFWASLFGSKHERMRKNRDVLGLAGEYRLAVARRDSDTRVAILRALGQIQRSASPREWEKRGQARAAIREALGSADGSTTSRGDSEPSVRIVAGEVLAATADSKDERDGAISALTRAAYSDPAEAVRTAAVTALAGMGSPATDALLDIACGEALEDKAGATTSPRPASMDLALEGLRRQQGESAARAFVELWWRVLQASPKRPLDSCRLDLLTSLLSTVQGPDSVRLLADIASELEDHNRYPIYEALAKSTSPDAFPALESSWTTARAAARVARDGSRSETFRAQDILKAFGKCRDPRALELLLSVVTRPDRYGAEIAASASTALESFLADPRVVDELVNTLQREEPHPAAWQAALLLASLGDRGAAPLLAALEHRRAEVRSAAAHACGCLGLTAPEGLASNVAVEVVPRHPGFRGRSRETVVGALTSALFDESGHVRERAAASLAQLGVRPTRSGARAMQDVLLARWSEVATSGAEGGRALLDCLTCEDFQFFRFSERHYALLGELGPVDACGELTKVAAQATYVSIAASSALSVLLERLGSQVSDEELCAVLALRDRSNIDGPDPECGYRLDCAEAREIAKAELSRRGRPIAESATPQG